MTPPMESPSTTTLDLVPPARTTPARAESRFIYIAVPWTPLGGGMYKVADYLIQAQQEGTQAPVLRPLDTRGSGSAAASIVQVMRAVARLARARFAGQVAGVH